MMMVGCKDVRTNERGVRGLVARASTTDESDFGSILRGLIDHLYHSNQPLLHR